MMSKSRKDHDQHLTNSLEDGINYGHSKIPPLVAVPMRRPPLPAVGDQPNSPASWAVRGEATPSRPAQPAALAAQLGPRLAQQPGDLWKWRELAVGK